MLPIGVTSLKELYFTFKVNCFENDTLALLIHNSSIRLVWKRSLSTEHF